MSLTVFPSDLSEPSFGSVWLHRATLACKTAILAIFCEWNCSFSHNPSPLDGVSTHTTSLSAYLKGFPLGSGVSIQQVSQHILGSWRITRPNDATYLIH